jgi:serine/threonine protein kinase
MSPEIAEMKRISRSRPCPSSAEWQALLSGVLSADTVRAMESHLDDCPACAAGLAALMPETPSLLKAAAGAAATPSADIWYMRLRSALRADNSTINNVAETTDDLLATPPLMTRVGDYELIESIGRGGMGIVYRARQIKLQRDVAVKMLPSQMSRSAAAMQRLIEEARRLAHVKHTNIVQVHDVGFQDGVPFFSMELIEGKTLADMIRKSSIDVRRAAALTRTIAEAVQAAHDADVIHRDLKPSNILMTADEEPKVTDFGLATTRDEAISRGHGEAAGTAEYMVSVFSGALTEASPSGTLRYRFSK